MEITEQRIADKRRAIVTKGLLSKPWLEEIRAQVAENFKEANVNAEEEKTQPTDENEQKEDSRRSEHPPTAENPELDKILTFTFGIVKWTSTDLENLQIKMRALLTRYRFHHPRAAKARLTVPRQMGGSGWID